MAFDLTVAILLAILVGSVTILGGLLSAKSSWHRKLFWVLGPLGVVLTITQAVRQAQSQDASMKTITGGNSFSFARLQFDGGDAYFSILSSGQYLLYDLNMRLWQPEEWKNTPMSPDVVFSKVAAETSTIGTLSNDDFRMGAAKSRLPVAGTMYDIQFSARNGSWLQTLWVRPSVQGWKVASIVRHVQKVGGVEAQKLGHLYLVPKIGVLT